MRVFYSDRHACHAPSGFISRGQRKPCPETPARAEIFLRALERAGHDILPVEAFDLAPLRSVHDAGYLEYLQRAWSMWSELPEHSDEVVPNVHPGRRMSAKPRAIVGLAGYYHADCASPIGPGTWEAARAAADTALSAASAVMARGGRAFAYALCRPPGHHAFADTAGGFCYLNNSAIAAQHCRERGAARVAVVDVDVHHGNGTQGIFYHRPDVLTVSLHGDPAEFYPFYAGYEDEAGEDAGEGSNLNVALPRGTGDDVYLERLEQALAHLRDFAPEALVLALGLDASRDDPLAFLAITTPGFARIGAAVGALNLPTVIVQEGGYVSDSLGENLAAALRGFEEARA